MKRIKRTKGIELGSILGIDQSARGTAAVILNDGKFVDAVFYADTKRDAQRLGGRGARTPLAVKAGDEVGKIVRLADLKYVLCSFLERWKPTYAALEDYALARQAHSHALGEVGGLVRLELWRAKIPYRVYDVQAVKIFSTGKGNAEKADVILACRDRWEKLNFLEYGKALGAGGNVADAYVIAQLLTTELRIRSGEVSLESLPDEERRVFLRTTKQHLTNILDLPFAIRRN